MDLYFVYLLKSCGILALFCLIYELFLKRDTFFTSHRYFFLLGIFCSLCVPFAVFTRTVLVAPVALIPAEATTAIPTDTIGKDSTFWVELIAYLYFSGVILFGGRFLLQLLSLNRLFRKSASSEEGPYRHHHTSEQMAPFSFFNRIVCNPDMYDKETLQTIMLHEKVHVNQWHSLDIIIVNLYCILFWFNPLAWWFKNTMTQNLEYIADAETVNQAGDLKKYQYLLLHETVDRFQASLANNFFNSLIKKRIVMLQKSRSEKKNLWKYSLILPLLATFMFAFNVKTVAQTHLTEKVKSDELIMEYQIDKNTSDKTLNDHSKKLSSEYGVDLKFTNVDRNNAGEIIAISSSFKQKGGSSGNYSLNNEDGIGPFVFFMRDKDGKKSFGYASKESYDMTLRHLRNHEVNETTEVHAVSETIGHEEHVSENSDTSITIHTTDTDPNSKIHIKSKKPGSAASIEFTGEKPLFIVDGKEKGKDFDASSLNVEDIAEMNVFKGESAIEKYGKKGKDGVVVITTKKGKN